MTIWEKIKYHRRQNLFSYYCLQMQVIQIKVWKLASRYWKDTLQVIWPEARPSRLCFGVHACLPLLCRWLHPARARAGAAELGGPALTHRHWATRAEAEALCGRGSGAAAPNICSSWLPTRIISLVRAQFCSCSARQNCPLPQPNSVHGQQHGRTRAQMITLSESGRRPKQSNF